jgi:hypothetical protein
MFGTASLAYFSYQRPVQTSGAGQRYLVADETIWSHARPDLADLRLYAGQTETPYTLLTEHSREQQQRTSLAVLQQSVVAGKTQFLIDMSGVTSYDHVTLGITARNFVAHAHVEGADDPHAKTWAAPGDSILYDLSKENLGSNTVLRLPRSTYKYLRVTLDGQVRPDEVTGASSEMAEARPAAWRDVSNAPRREQSGKDTVLTFAVPENVPVEKVTLSIDPAQPNFERSVEIQSDNGTWISGGELNRIHLVRSGRKIDSEQQEILFAAPAQKTLKVIIHNGDDPPLKLTGARLEQLERRIYFEAHAGPLSLYYGDLKVDAPIYDYAKLFVRDPSAIAAQLGAESSNPAYTGRPDERPWSEKHPAVLWIVIVIAVLTLGAVAVRSMRRA